MIQSRIFGVRFFALVAIAVSTGLFSQVSAETTVSADDTRIRYYGRFDVSTPEAPRFTWSGAVIEARFTGSYIGFMLEDGHADYDVEIDGTLDTIIRTDAATESFSIRNDLSEGTHVIRIVRRSEDHYNAAIFKGFILADGGGDLVDPLPEPERKIEFIGDSYTVGYGNESPSRTCDEKQLRNYTNTNRSFPTLVTKAFHAQSVILGWSGAGVVRNYGEGKKRSDEPYPVHYNKTLGKASSGVWDFSRWVPDLVVICLGTNDFSTTPHPDESMYVGDYHTLLGRVHDNYPDAAAVCVSTHNGPCVEYVKQVVDEQRTTHSRNDVFYAEFPNQLENTGCDWHPNLVDDKNVAALLIDTIMNALDWDTSEVITGIHRNAQAYACSGASGFLVQSGRSGSLLLSTGMSHAAVPVRFVSLQGRTLCTKSVRGELHVSISELPQGICLVGNTAIGWKSVVVKR